MNELPYGQADPLFLWWLADPASPVLDVDLLAEQIDRPFLRLQRQDF